MNSIDWTMKHPQHIVAVFGLIRNATGKVLMIESPRRGWELPGGRVEEGEDLIRALEREILEETGVKTEIGRLIGVYSRLNPPFMVLLGLVGEYQSGDLVTSEESLAVEWVMPDQVIARISHPAIRDRAQDLLADHIRHRSCRPGQPARLVCPVRRNRQPTGCKSCTRSDRVRAFRASIGFGARIHARGWKTLGKTPTGDLVLTGWDLPGYWARLRRGPMFFLCFVFRFFF